MVCGLGDGANPILVGDFQVFLNFRAGHLYYIELILKRINGKQVVEYQRAGFYVAVVGEGSGKGNLGRCLREAQRVDEVHVVAHAFVGVAGVELRIQDAHFLEGEVAHGFKILAEILAHDGIGLLCFHGNEVCLKGFAHNFTLLNLQVHLPVGHIAAVAAGVEQRTTVPRLNVGPVVVAADEPVHPFYQVEGVQGLRFQDLAVSLPAGRVHGGYNYIRMLLGAYLVYIDLDKLGDGHKVHTAPEFLGEPGLDIGVVIADDGNPQAGFFHHLVQREIGLPVVVADGIARQERRANPLEVRRHAVVHLVAGFNVVVAHGDGVVLHVFQQAREQVRRERVDIVEVVGGVVPLEAVAGVYQEDIPKAVGRTDTVDVIVHGKERLAHLAVYVGGVEPGAVYVVGREHRKGVIAVFELVRARQQKA